jgi:hypothetical protein
LKDWLDLMVKKIKRTISSATAPPATEQDDESEDDE